MAEIEREYDWDDEIVKDSDFTLIPEGDYNFTVVAFERGRHEGSNKLPPCNKAIVTLRIALPDGSTQELKNNLFLHSKCEGLLSAFFTAIGQKRKGEPLRMNWGAVIGSTGRCKITIRTWQNNYGEDMQSNEVKKFYPPEDIPAQQTASVPPQNTPANAVSTPGGIFTPGKF